MPTQNIPNANQELRIPCPRHEGFYISHGCSYVDSKKDVLFCSQCLMENLDYVNEHKHYIQPLNRFIVDFYGNIETVKDIIKPYEAVHQSEQKHIHFFETFIQDQKQLINQEVKIITDQFLFMIEKIKTSAFTELDQVQEQLRTNYSQLNSLFKNSEINHLQIANYIELSQKLSQQPSNQQIPYILNLRSCLQELKDPLKSNTIRNVQKVTSQIQAFKKNDSTNHLNLSNVCSKSFKHLYSELENKLQYYISEVALPFDPQNVNAVEQSPFMRANKNSVSMQDSFAFKKPNGLEQNQYRQSTRDFLSESPQKLQFNKMEKHSASKKPHTIVESFKSSKNCLLNKQITFDQKRGDLVLEALYDSEQEVSALCQTSIYDNLVAVGCKDGVIRVVKFGASNFDDKNDLHLLCMYQIQTVNDRSAVWSMTKCHPKGQDGHFFAAGYENGHIYIWKLDPQLQKRVETVPYTIIKNTSKDIISTLLDLGSIHSSLIYGDGSGCLKIWDYKDSQIIGKYQEHQGQINTLCLYNQDNNLAAGSYDGTISLWSIKTSTHAKTAMTHLRTINNNSYVYSITSFQNQNGSQLIISDNDKRVRLLDTKLYELKDEFRSLHSNESILEILTLDTGIQNFFLCFTKTQLLVLSGNTFKLVKSFDNQDLYNNNIGFTMCSNYKVVYLPLENPVEDSISFSIIDQSNQTNRIVSIFTIEF